MLLKPLRVDPHPNPLPLERDFFSSRVQFIAPFYFGKMFVFVIYLICLGFVLSFSFYCLGFCSTIAVIDCALLVINSAIATSSFTLRKIRSAQIKRKRSTKKKRNQLRYQNSSSSLCHFVASCLSCVAA